MEDRVYAAVDANTQSSYLGWVDLYMNTPDSYLMWRSYGAAPFWSYLMEQFGTQTNELASGSDVLVRLWERVPDRSLGTLSLARGSIRGLDRHTTERVDTTAVLEDVFQDFSIALAVKHLNCNLLPDPARFRIADEHGTNATSWGAVTSTFLGQLSTNNTPTVDTASWWGGKYYGVHVDVNAHGLIGFVATNAPGDFTSFSVMARKRPAFVDDILQSGTYVQRGSRFAAMFIQDPADPYIHLDVVANGRSSEDFLRGLARRSEYTYWFATGMPDLEIAEPSSNYPAYVGWWDDSPGRFLVRARVTGTGSLGGEAVAGLAPSDFTVHVGATRIPSNEAPVLAGAYVRDEYWLTCRAPEKYAPAPKLFDLHVTLGVLTNTVAHNAVLYEPRILDEVLVLDKSGSMRQDRKDAAAASAASMFISAAQTNDQLATVVFRGNGSEPDNDGQVLFSLELMDDEVARETARNTLGLVSPSGATPLGDGVATAVGEIATNGQVVGEDWIVLLSDGYENEDLRWADVEGLVLSNGVRISTVALGPACDAALLQDIAEITGGRFFYVDAPDGTTATARVLAPMLDDDAERLFNGLADTYMVLSEDLGGLQRLWQERRALPAYAKTNYMVSLPGSGYERGVISVHWIDDETALSVSASSPAGGPVSSGVDGVSIHSAPGRWVARIDGMTGGTWNVQLTASSNDVRFVSSVAVRDPLGPVANLYFGQNHGDSAIALRHGRYLRGLPMPIVVVLTDQDGPVREADVLATVRHPTDGDLVLRLLDDGGHGDGMARDGVYANLYTPTTAWSPTGLADDPATPHYRGCYNVSVHASGSDNSDQDFTRIRKGTFQVYDDIQPDPDTDGDGMPDRYEHLHPGLKHDSRDDKGDLDADGLNNGEEYRLGTDPLAVDTDRGGESDRSEWARAANPFDPLDDALPWPEEVYIVSTRTDSIPVPDLLQPGTLLLRYPLDPLYHKIKVYRAPASSGPFALINQVLSADAGGFYRDHDVINGVPYFYRVVALDLAGNETAPSPIATGTPKADPVPPIGGMLIASGRRFTEDTLVDLTVDAESETKWMRFSSRPDFRGAAWQPFANTVPFSLVPNPSGVARVYGQFSDPSSNVSVVCEDAIQIVPTGTLGRVTGSALLLDAPAGYTDENICVYIAAGGDDAPVYTDVTGGYELPGLMPGVYDIAAGRWGFTSVTTRNARVTSGGVTNLPTMLLTLTDSDGDGLLDLDEDDIGTNPLAADTDGDRLPDGWEMRHGFNATGVLSYAVTVGPRSGGGNAFYVDAVERPDLEVPRLTECRFQLDGTTTLGHPFFFATNDTGGGSYTAEHLDGVENSRGMTGTVVLATSTSTPVRLYYACGSHVDMGAMITLTESEGERDHDGDGIDTYGEYLCRTDPTNAGSFLHFSVPPDVSGGSGVVITWSSVEGVTYQLDYSTNLAVSGWQFLTNAPAAPGPVTHYTDTTFGADAARFYRVMLLE